MDVQEADVEECDETSECGPWSVFGSGRVTLCQGGVDAIDRAHRSMSCWVSSTFLAVAASSPRKVDQERAVTTTHPSEALAS